MTDLLELADRLEAAEAGSRELDAEVHGIIGDATQRRHLDMLGPFGPRYTTSIDAAMKLRPEKSLWSVCDMEDGPFAQVIRPMPDGGFIGGLRTGRGSTAALALCAAALRARAVS